MNRTTIGKFNSQTHLKNSSMQFESRDASPLCCDQKGGASLVSDGEFPPTPLAKNEFDSQQAT